VRRFSLFRAAVLAAAFLLPVASDAAAKSAEAGTVVYLIRHAEKAAAEGASGGMMDAQDPPLSEAGERRAAHLAGLLGEAGATRIFTTGYKRTRQTVLPLSEETGITIEPYDPRDLAGFAEKLRGMGGRVVVAGTATRPPSSSGILGEIPDPRSPRTSTTASMSS